MGVTYPSIIVNVQESHKLTSTELDFVTQSRNVIHVHAVHIALERHIRGL